MPLFNLPYQARNFVDACPCDTVTVCLDPLWSARTVSGDNVVTGILQNTGRYLAGYRAYNRFSARCEKQYQYSVVVDDAQFIVDPGTGLKYHPSCDDVNSIDPCI